MTPRLLPAFSAALGLVALYALDACDASEPSVAPILEATAAIAAGADCPAGGSAVSVGHDGNGNGVLDAGEVEHVTNVCNLQVPPTVSRVEVEPAGEHCVTGGHVVESGPDRDRSGILDDSEVTSTTYACDPSDLFVGDFTAAMWNDPAQVAALEQARIVTGTLTVASDANAFLPYLTMVGGLTIAPGASPEIIELPALTQINGNLLVIASDLDKLALPVLASVGGSVQIDTARELGWLALPALATVGQDVLVTDTQALEIADLSGLRGVGGTIDLVSIPILRSIDLPALTSASRLAVVGTGVFRVSVPGPVTLDALDIEGNAVLFQIALPRLVHAGQVRVLQDAELHQLDLGSLGTRDEGTGAVDSVDIELTGLDVIDLPMGITADRIVVSNNRALTSLRLAHLISAHGVIVARSPALVTLDVGQLQEVDDLTLSGPLGALTLSSSLVVHHALTYAATGLARLPPARLDPRASLVVVNNPALVDLRGLDLPATLSWVAIESNPLLTSLVGLEAVAQLQTLQVGPNAALVDLSGLGSLIEADTIELRANAAMTSLHGLERLAGLTNYLSIMDEPALRSLDGLDALEHIGGALIVTRNPVLASLDGLAALQSVGLAYGTVNGGPSVFISDNAALAPDAGAALLARIRHN